MIFNYKNNYIKLPTHEPERITQVINPNDIKNQEEKIISEIKRELIIYNIITLKVLLNNSFNFL